MSSIYEKGQKIFAAYPHAPAATHHQMPVGGRVELRNGRGEVEAIGQVIETTSAGATAVIIKVIDSGQNRQVSG